MADLHQLENKMRMIKLSGMVETLNMRLDQAQKEGLAFTQFLEILLEDEVQHRANKRLATRIIRARFEEEKNLEGFDFNFNPKLPAAYIRELATCQFIERKESLILCGPVGVGNYRKNSLMERFSENSRKCQKSCRKSFHNNHEI